MKQLVLSLALVGCTALAAHAERAKGYVFEDLNANGTRDEAEPGLADISVSNGEEVVRTDASGAYALPVDDDTILFVVKPSGWRTPYDHNGSVARFYYVHKPKGSNVKEFPGVEPTGPLPAEVNFALVRQEEPAQFRMIVQGDPQPRNLRDVDFLSHDVYEELLTVPATMGASMGDLLFDGLELYPDIIAQAGLLGIPWLHVIGNHDINFDATDPRASDDTYEKWLGPSWYATEYANVHFIVLNNIWWLVKERKYEGRFGDDQLTFLRNNLAHVDKNKLIVLMMHIPLWDCVDKDAVVAALQDFPHTFSLSAHTHVQSHEFMPAPGGSEHHHLNLMTAGGSWMRGSYDELGIPHTTMRDGGPNGYAIMNIDGNQFSMDFKAARRPAEYQMDIWAPEDVPSAQSGAAEVIVNFFSGNSKSKLEMRVNANGEWMPLAQQPGIAPYYEREFNRHVNLLKKIAEFGGKDASNEKVLERIANEFMPYVGRTPPEPDETPHLWKGQLPANLPAGYHTIQVRATDMWGKVHAAQRILRVLP